MTRIWLHIAQSSFFSLKGGESLHLSSSSCVGPSLRPRRQHKTHTHKKTTEASLLRSGSRFFVPNPSSLSIGTSYLHKKKPPAAAPPFEVTNRTGPHLTWQKNIRRTEHFSDKRWCIQIQELLSALFAQGTHLYCELLLLGKIWKKMWAQRAAKLLRSLVGLFAIA